MKTRKGGRFSFLTQGALAVLFASDGQAVEASSSTEPAPLASQPAAVALSTEPPPPQTPAVVATAPQATPSMSPLRIEGPSGNSIRLGLLLQPQYQAQSSPTLGGYAQNLYIRRTRILVGGTLFGALEYFFDTDYPNLFFDNNVAAAGAADSFMKNTPGMNVQDAFVTYRALGDAFKVDVGYMLPPMAHNAVQGAGTLLAWDYFSYTFQHGNRFASSANPFGRDVGLQLRGLVIGGHLEYRLGLFQGKRENRTATDMEARNFFRMSGRVQVNILDPESGFFYAGSYLGSKKILSIGAAVDLQDSYKYFAVDGVADLPLGPGFVAGQVNVAYWNGNGFIPALVQQTAFMGEVAYIFMPVAVSPVVRYEHLWGSNPVPSESRYAAGIAFWPHGHNLNLKGFYSRVETVGAPNGYNQFNVQLQTYFF